MNAKQFLGAISAMIIRIAMAAVIIVAVFRLAVYAYDFGYQVFADVSVSEGEGRVVSVVVSDGLSSRELAKLLEQKGLINDANVFYVYERLSDYKDKLKPGTYELSTAMNAEEMLEIMCDTQAEPESESEEN
ncbi:MAG: endolytic transglycosylase MltG [Lachnospiraceae bacterium]|nr:endolytic transglycosylase MltG [Lachnospiraceae bacterium]MDE6984960.1 endolytic transglycosylase MltG [Lachnospiraceae bacterium]MDE7030146.1 endolytic transglycosylase MltG [Lachnospiraceae bacterium]